MLVLQKNLTQLSVQPIVSMSHTVSKSKWVLHSRLYSQLSQCSTLRPSQSEFYTFVCPVSCLNDAHCVHVIVIYTVVCPANCPNVAHCVQIKVVLTKLCAPPTVQMLHTVSMYAFHSCLNVAYCFVDLVKVIYDIYLKYDYWNYYRNYIRNIIYVMVTHCVICVYVLKLIIEIIYEI